MTSLRTFNLVTAIALVGACNPALAQGTPPSNGAEVSKLAEIIVTARQREESSQDVPVSIISLSGAQLQLSHLDLAAEIVPSIPNMQLQFLNPRQAAFSIRGLGSNPASEGLENSVGLYLDGVYISRPGMLTSNFDDVEQLTVLRGPQGTLFGKNTTAGALIVNTRKPERAFKSDVEISAGRFGLTQIHANVTGPFSATLSGRMSAFYTGRDGTVENRFNGAILNNLNKVGARGQLYFQPNDSLSLRLIADFAHQQENANAEVLVDPGLTLANGSARPNNIFVRSARFGYTPKFDPFARQVNINQPQVIETTQAGASLEANWSLNGYTLTSISAWRRWEYLPTNDLDSLPLDILHAAGSNIWDRQLSEEIRIASPINRRLDFVAGLFWYRQQLEAATVPGSTYGADAAKFFSQPNLILPAYALEGLTGNTQAHAAIDSYALFGQGSWHINDRWVLAAGLRSNWDRKEAIVSRTRSGGSVLSVTDRFFAAATAARNQLVPGNATADNKSSGNTLSGSLSLTYRPTDTLLLYGSLARGVKAAGLNTVILPVGADPLVKPEIVLNAELGVKSRWLDDRMRLNFNLFWANIDNYQTTVRNPVLIASYLANAKSARTRGAELEVSWLVLDGLQLNTAIAYNDATYTSFHAAPCGIEWAGIATSCDLTGQPISGAPRWSGSVRGEYTRALANNLRGFGGVEYTYKSSNFFNGTNSSYSLIDGYGLLNMHMGVGSSSGRWQVSLWAKNLLNKDYFMARTAELGALNSGYVPGTVGDPRSYGVSLRVRL